MHFANSAQSCCATWAVGPEENLIATDFTLLLFIIIHNTFFKPGDLLPDLFQFNMKGSISNNTDR